MENLHERGKHKEDKMSLEKLIAFLFQTSGKEKLTEKEIYMILSFKLGWLTPAQGRLAIQKAIEKNLIKKDGDNVIPNFDYKSVNIPFEFRYDEKMLEMEENLLEKLINRIVMEGNIGEKRIRKEIDEEAKKLCVYPEVAALLIGKKYGVRIDDLINEIKEFVRNKELK